jgi:hypothetical protein
MTDEREPRVFESARGAPWRGEVGAAWPRRVENPSGRPWGWRKWLGRVAEAAQEGGGGRQKGWRK